MSAEASEYQVACWNWWLDAGRPERVDGRRPARAIGHFYPLHYYKRHGIEPGLQYDILGKLAARYARDFTTRGLADQLWAVLQASENVPRHPMGPWTERHAVDTAVRAKRFTDRMDQQQEAAVRSYLAARGGPPGRQPGAREHGVRKPGVRAR